MDWASQTETLLQAIAVPELDPLFWRSDRTGVSSAWYGHVPFAHWLVRAAVPRCIVELGAHNGVSYAAFCRAVQRERLGTRCFAVDTWEGDEHAGFYGEDVYNDFRAYHDDRFSSFSTLLRRTFDAALEMVPDHSIDLLHIDGRHRYEDVRHDYEQWRSKMSDRCVVLFHDTNVREHGFGVWKFWSEIRQEFPHFEFAHGFGLGVLAVGPQCPSLICALTELDDTSAAGAVRERFAQLGERCSFEAEIKKLNRQLGERSRQCDETTTRLENAEADLAVYRRDFPILQTAIETLQADIGISRQEAAAAQQEAAAAQEKAAAAQQESAAIQQAAAAVMEDLQKATRAAAAAETARQAAAEAIAEADRERLEAIAQAHRQQQRAAIAEQERIAAEEADKKIEVDRRVAAELMLDSILQSSTWRATWPMRAGLRRLPLWVRRSGRAGARLAWRAVTPHLKEARRSSPAAAEPLASTSAPAALAPPPAAPVQPLAPIRTPATAPLVCYVSGEPDTPGTIYRVQRYADACAAAGARVLVIRLDEVATHTADAASIDVVVIWRAIWTDELGAFVDEARANGARIVFDVDDLMIDPALATIDVIDGIRSQNILETAVQAHYARVQRTMFAADFGAASTDELAGHMRRFGKIGTTLPNGFDMETFETSRMAARRRLADKPDGLVRLGYASGSRTHQRDFAEIASILPSVLRAHPESCLVLFRATGDVKLVEISEFPELQPFESQIEWRDLVPLQRLPDEIARFDINLAPLQLGNLFCEAKSELKFFEGALAGVCTVASPVGPYARAIQHGSNGFLAATPAQWEAVLLKLLDDPALRRSVAQTALNDILWPYGPQRRVQLMRRVLAEWMGGPAAADSFVLEHHQRTQRPRRGVTVPAGETLFHADQLRQAKVTVIIPLYNYAHTVVEALDSVRAQSLADLDLVVVDDCSTDQSLQVALDWVHANAGRFTRVSVIRNHANAGLGYTRNAAFSAAETAFILPLDADNVLRPQCCELLLEAATTSGAGFAYPVIQEFGGRAGVIGTLPYDPSRLIGGNYIDAMALIAKGTWSAVGGYAQMRQGWEDYDFWCAAAEMGLYGVAVGGSPLADYRVHDASMLSQITNKDGVHHQVVQTIERRHPWATVTRPLVLNAPAETPPLAPSGLDRLLPILRCPETGQTLHVVDGALQSQDGSRQWPLKAGRPILFAGMAPADVAEYSHLSNEVPESALELIRTAKGLVLNLSAGGTAERFDNVIEAEAAIFGHTDLVADSHALPFADEVFEVVIAMNAFEHYRDPLRAAAEIRRVLKPGGKVLIRTAFLQPQHEPPYHFYNATRFGVAEWFAAFETEQLHVSENFNPSYALSWMAHECKTALQRDAGSEVAEAFAAEPVGRFAEFWTNPASRSHRAWQGFNRLSQPSQEAIAAGFEYLGRRPIA